MYAGTFCSKASPQIKLLKWSLSEAFVLSTSARVTYFNLKYIPRQPNCSGKIIIGGTFWTFTFLCCKGDKNVRILCKRKQNYSLKSSENGKCLCGCWYILFRRISTQQIFYIAYFFSTQEFKLCVLSSSARAGKLNTVCPVSVKLQRKNGPFPALSVMSHVTCVTPGSPTYEVALVFVLLGCFA